MAGGGRPTGGPAYPLDVEPPAIGAPSAPSPIVGAPYPGLGPNRDGTSPDLVCARRRVRDRSSHLRLCRLFYEADRRPRLAARPENRPRRDLVAPVCCPYRIAMSRRHALRRARRARAGWASAFPPIPCTQAAETARRCAAATSSARSQERGGVADRWRVGCRRTLVSAARPPAVADADEGQQHHRERDRETDPGPAGLELVVLDQLHERRDREADAQQGGDDRRRPAAHREPRDQDGQELPDEDRKREERCVETEVRSFVPRRPAAFPLADVGRRDAHARPGREHLDQERGAQQDDQLRSERPVPVAPHGAGVYASPRPTDATDLRFEKSRRSADYRPGDNRAIRGGRPACQSRISTRPWRHSGSARRPRSARSSSDRAAPSSCC